MHMTGWTMTCEQEAADMNEQGLWAAHIGTRACRRQVHPRQAADAHTLTSGRCKEGCKWCCFWEDLTPVLCEQSGSSARTYAHLLTQVRAAHVPVGLRSLASLSARQDQVRAPCHERQGPSAAPIRCLQHAANMGSRHRQVDSVMSCEGASSRRQCQSQSELVRTAGPG